MQSGGGDGQGWPSRFKNSTALGCLAGFGPAVAVVGLAVARAACSCDFSMSPCCAIRAKPGPSGPRKKNVTAAKPRPLRPRSLAMIAATPALTAHRNTKTRNTEPSIWVTLAVGVAAGPCLFQIQGTATGHHRTEFHHKLPGESVS